MITILESFGTSAFVDEFVLILLLLLRLRFSFSHTYVATCDVNSLRTPVLMRTGSFFSSPFRVCISFVVQCVAVSQRLQKGNGIGS